MFLKKYGILVFIFAGLAGLAFVYQSTGSVLGISVTNPFLAQVIPTPVPPKVTTLAFAPSSQVVSPGTSFKEQVVLNAGVPVVSAQLEIIYNPALFEATNVSIISAAFPNILSSPATDNTNGKVTVTIGTASIQSSFTGTANIAEITFRSKTSSAGQQKIAFGTNSFIGSVSLGNVNALTGTLPALITTGPVPITPTPSICKAELLSFATDTPCGNNNFRYANYSCMNKKSMRDGGSTSCKSIETWAQYGRNYCSSSCTPSTPTLYPQRTPTPMRVCTSNTQCPTGQYCVSGYCRAGPQTTPTPVPNVTSTPYPRTTPPMATPPKAPATFLKTFFGL